MPESCERGERIRYIRIGQSDIGRLEALFLTGYGSLACYDPTGNFAPRVAEYSTSIMSGVRPIDKSDR
jgi:hypothetical protein